MTAHFPWWAWFAISAFWMAVAYSVTRGKATHSRFDIGVGVVMLLFASVSGIRGIMALLG
jgi:hypothetical protein